LFHSAGIQDRDGAPAGLAEVCDKFPWLRHVFADGGYAGQKLRRALTKLGDWTIDIIGRSDTARGLNYCPEDGSLSEHLHG
jgi:Transposase DDE domain